MMDHDKIHKSSDQIIKSLSKKFPGVKFKCNGYLIGPDIYCFIINDYELYTKKTFKIRSKVLSLKYGRKHRFIIAFKSF